MTLTQNELDTIKAMPSEHLRMRLAEGNLNDETVVAIAAELARREQAQHTPTESLRRWQVERLNQQNAELAAENERLRGLLADAYSELLSHHLSKAGDLGIPHERAMAMISEMPLMWRIKAAKEAL